jgi:PAS domain S-box-containing protein
MQEELITSEIRYRRLFEAARDGFLILNAETLKITDANPFMTELLDYSRDEFLGKELWEIGLFNDKEASQSCEFT